MAFGRSTKILLILLAACAILDVPVAEGFFKECWDTWSRCSKWSSAGTGKIWQGCDTRCKCIGRSGGKCVLTRSQCPLSKMAWQCDCFGSYGNRKPGKWCGF